MERMAAHFGTLLSSIVAAPSTQISALQLMQPAERQIVLSKFNKTAAPYQKEACIHNLFAASAARVRHSLHWRPGAVRIPLQATQARPVARKLVAGQFLLAVARPQPDLDSASTRCQMQHVSWQAPTDSA